jgi:serine/threonine protein phosphatase 1
LRYIIGDIHGCGIEFLALLSQLDNATDIYCVGDLFDRGVDPYKVWELVTNFDIHCVMGNHEQKMLNFLTGKRDHLPPTYYFALDQLFNKGVKRKDLIAFLEKLPRMIPLTYLGREIIITHAGINPENPYDDSAEFTTYGSFDPVPWWELHITDSPLVIYGHLSQPFPDTMMPRVISNGNKINSIGIDTGACHGYALTAYCVETAEMIQVPCRWDAAGLLRANLDRLGKPWRVEMRNKLFVAPKAKKAKEDFESSITANIAVKGKKTSFKES